MLLIGLLLLIVAVVFGADMVWENTFHISGVTAFGQSLGITNAAAFFVIGVITGAAIVLGIVLLMAGLGRKGKKAVRHHKERKETKTAHAEQDQLRSDNERLHAELDQQAGTDGHGGQSVPGAPKADPPR